MDGQVTVDAAEAPASAASVEVAREQLDAIARRIEDAVAKGNAKVAEADVHFIEAGKQMLEAKKLVQSGALGPEARWEVWARQNIKLSDSWRRSLMQIAKADDPAAELRRWREARREIAQRHRQRQGGSPQVEPERKTLIAFAREAPMDEVRDVVDYVEDLKRRPKRRELPALPDRIDPHGDGAKGTDDTSTESEPTDASEAPADQATLH